ncbi:MAG: hypothetical protein ACM3H7_00905, partial [Acidobacteriaceae bacterium]
MSSERKHKWLKFILAAKVVFCFIVWGLPSLLAPLAIIQRLGVPTPDDPFFMRLSGALIITLGTAYWFAYRDPIKNNAIVKVGVVDNGLATLLILIFIAFYDLQNIFMYVSSLLTFIFF